MPRARYQSLLITCVLAFALLGCQGLEGRLPEPPPQQQPAPEVRSAVPGPHLPFGSPSAAPANGDIILIAGEGSVISYNNARGTPDWVAWRTTRSDLGDSLRRPEFRSDPRLPERFKRVGPSDYSGSGYDRGHMVPSADRFGNSRLNAETFLMTNIVPQAGPLNQYPWNDLEQFVRAEVRKGFDAYQIAGVYGEKGRIKGKIAIPTNCWKVVVLLPGGTDPAAIDRRARVIAVDMPNSHGVEHQRWRRFATTAGAIEQRTGLDLFSILPSELQQALETRAEIVSR